MPNQYTSLPMPARFWANVATEGPVPPHRPELGRCWLWTRRPVGNGYGQFRFEGRSRPAHVVSWLITHGPIRAGAFICHHCDVRICVRPSHLFVGDQDINMADMVAKRRGALGRRNGKYTQPERTPRGERWLTDARQRGMLRGSSHPNARLTEDLVREARRRYAAGGLSVEALADWAGVSKPTMARVVNGTSWTHVTAMPHPGRARANYLAAHQRRQRSAPTDIERALMHALDTAGIGYVFQQAVGGRFLCDFGFPDAMLLVEVDGSYWHSTARHQERDASKAAYLEACGYTVLRFSDVDVKHRLDSCLAQIRTHLRPPD